MANRAHENTTVRHISTTRRPIVGGSVGPAPAVGSPENPRGSEVTRGYLTPTTENGPRPGGSAGGRSRASCPSVSLVPH